MMAKTATRITITNHDIVTLFGVHTTTASRKLRAIREALKLPADALVTIDDFLQVYPNVREERLREVLR